MNASVFHAGEQQVQTRAGVRETIEPWARKVIRPFMPDQHRAFYSQLPFVVAAARDASGRPWATLLVGSPGFIQSPGNDLLELSTTVIEGDALESSLLPGTELGFLGIELETRRRNRVNGQLAASEQGTLQFRVGQAFGNCPQYITEREWRIVDADPAAALVTSRDRLDDEMRAWIGAADTMFLATGYDGDGGHQQSFGMDASHRGGAPGFVEIVDDRKLVFPDFAGNNHFNTVGNLLMDSRIGLLFVDFDKGSLLQLTGIATIDWDSDEVAKYPGAQRLICVSIEEIVRLDAVLPLRWSQPAESVRNLRVARRIRESADVVSFDLVPADGSELAVFEAGQHLPVELQIEELSRPLRRTYSLSNSPSDGHYRISVKRHAKGLASRILHDAIREGDVIRTRLPAGDFVLANATKPAMLISAGIGVTPMLSMLHQLDDDAGEQPVVFVHGARDGAHHALAGEVKRLAAHNGNVSVDVSYSRPRSDDVLGRDYDRVGRVDADVIAELIPGADTDFYLCGPIRFMSDIADALANLGVPAERIHTETFGPAAE